MPGPPFADREIRDKDKTLICRPGGRPFFFWSLKKFTGRRLTRRHFVPRCLPDFFIESATKRVPSIFKGPPSSPVFSSLLTSSLLPSSFFSRLTSLPPQHYKIRVTAQIIASLQRIWQHPSSPTLSERCSGRFSTTTYVVSTSLNASSQTMDHPPADTPTVRLGAENTYHGRREAYVCNEVLRESGGGKRGKRGNGSKCVAMGRLGARFGRNVEYNRRKVSRRSI